MAYGLQSTASGMCISGGHMGVAREFLQSRDNIFYKGIKGLSVNVTHTMLDNFRKNAITFKSRCSKMLNSDFCSTGDKTGR